MDITKNNPFTDVENIMDSIKNLDNESLKETLALLIKVYVLDKGIEYEENAFDDTDDSEKFSIKTNSDQTKSFAELIFNLKQKYNFPELNNFIIENQNVFLQLNGNKYLISDNNINDKKEKNPQIKKDVQINNILKPSPERFKNIEMDKNNG